MPTAVKKIKSASFKDLIEQMGDRVIPFRERDVISVTVVQVTKNWIVVDVMGLAEGFIPVKEFSTDSEKLQPGQVIEASILVFEDDLGRMVLSLKRADREKYLTTLKEKFESKDSFDAKVVDANKGGLIIEVGGIQGFMPVSQLTSAHYPRVDGGDRQKILDKLQQFVGKNLTVRVITFEPQAGKIIFSEKAAMTDEQEHLLQDISVGEDHEATITGIADFGLFVTLETGLEGLVHIKEVAWEPVDELRTKFSIGDRIKVRVISTQGGRLSLSLKRLTLDPFLEELKKLKAGSKVSGSISRITPVGGAVRLRSGLELQFLLLDGEGESLQVGETKEFFIESIDREEHRAKLLLHQAKPAKKKAAAEDTPSEEIEPKKAKKG